MRKHLIRNGEILCGRAVSSHQQWTDQLEEVSCLSCLKILREAYRRKKLQVYLTPKETEDHRDD